MNFQHISKRGFSSVSKRLDMFYDVVSPYSYLAFEVFNRYQSRWNIDMNLRPMFLGGVMQATSNQPPGLNPTKGKYLHMDVLRSAKFFEVPFTVLNPARMLVYMGAVKMLFESSLQPMRFITAVQKHFPEHTEEVSRKFFQRRFLEDKESLSNDDLREVAMKTSLQEKDIDFILEQMSNPDIKDLLKKTTEEAVENGAFGAPYFVATIGDKKKAFFGSDRFPVMAFEIGEKWEGHNPSISSKL